VPILTLETRHLPTVVAQELVDDHLLALMAAPNEATSTHIDPERHLDPGLLDIIGAALDPYRPDRDLLLDAEVDVAIVPGVMERREEVRVTAAIAAMMIGAEAGAMAIAAEEEGSQCRVGCCIDGVLDLCSMVNGIGEVFPLNGKISRKVALGAPSQLKILGNISIFYRRMDKTLRSWSIFSPDIDQVYHESSSAPYDG